MADQFTLCLEAYQMQLRSLKKYFPKANQVSTDDNAPQKGGNYFAILRPASFSNNVHSQFEENEWHITTIIYMRYKELKDVWDLFAVYRGDILELRRTNPLKTNGIWRQVFSASDDAGFLTDENNNYLGFIAQTLDVTIYQKVRADIRL